MTRHKTVLVSFPFDDLISTKVRPAVCLTDPISQYNHVVVAFISSKIFADLLETDIVLESTRRDFALTGLRAPSTIRLH